MILIDQQLGGIGGLDVCKNLKEMYAFSYSNHLPVDFMSTHADGFIEKPFQKKILFQKIEELLLAY